MYRFEQGTVDGTIIIMFLKKEVKNNGITK